MTAIPYKQTLQVGIIGKKARTGYDYSERTGITEGTIKFGQLLAFGTSGKQVKPLELSTEKLAGIAIYDLTARDLVNLQYVDKEPLSYAFIGCVWVHSEEIVGVKDPVRIRIVDDGVDPLKVKFNFCKTASAGKTLLLSGCYWDNDTNATGLSALVLTDNAMIASAD